MGTASGITAFAKPFAGALPCAANGRDSSSNIAFRTRGTRPWLCVITKTMKKWRSNCEYTRYKMAPLVLFLMCLFYFGIAGAEEPKGEFVVRTVETTLVDKVYRLNTRLYYQLSTESLGALQKGIPLTIALNIEVLRQREYLWAEQIATIEQRYQLSYHALTQQYLVKNLNTGVYASFPTLQTALDYLSTIENFPMLDAQLLVPDEKYFARLRARLDLETLPVPIRVLAYISSGWRLSSEWYTWSLEP